MGQTFDLVLMANICTTSTLEKETVYYYKTLVTTHGSIWCYDPQESFPYTRLDGTLVEVRLHSLLISKLNGG